MRAGYKTLDSDTKINYLNGNFLRRNQNKQSFVMPLLEDEPKLPGRKLLTIGLPSFFVAMIVSLLVHQAAHLLVLKNACGGTTISWSDPLSFDVPTVECPVASLAGLIATFLLGLVSFAIYMRFPQNLFWGLMAFINASMRIPETIRVFLQLLISQKSDLPYDESVALNLLHVHDPVVGIVILCFLSITLISLTVIIIHDTRMVASKWVIAGSLFIVMIPLETLLWRFLAPMVA